MLRVWTERAGTWLSEEALTGLLLILILDMLVLPVLGPNVGQVVLNIVFTVLLLTGLAAVANRKVPFVLVGLIVFATVALRWMAPFPLLSVTKATALTASLVTISLFAMLVFLRTFSPGPITRHRVEGAVAAYLLIGLAFALAYEGVELLAPGSLQFAEGEPEVMDRAVEYFSLVTLTTLGYGDVTPASPLTRRLAMAEGLIGQLYPAIIIGWMVSSMTPRRRD
jgi:voltage-gated potassium channel Kch